MASLESFAYSTVPTEAEVIITNDPECTQPHALDVLASVSYAEAAALLKSNELGVQRFFEAKGCPEIGEALAKQGVSGSSIHMLTAANIERNLGLNLGRQLALKNFIQRVRVVSRSQRRRDEIWSEEEFDPQVEFVEVEGCCMSLSWLSCLCSCSTPEKRKTKERLRLPRQRYSLSDAGLRVVKSEWTDGFPADGKRTVEYEENCDCGCCCGWRPRDPPQHRITTDNIDLACIEDVDNFVLSSERKHHELDCNEMCFGYEVEEVRHPAQIVVTYVERGGGADEPRRKTLLLKVNPETMEDTTLKILAARDEAKARMGVFPSLVEQVAEETAGAVDSAQGLM
mmetsp:Transcript_87589/g.283577  ORF Transcript_87589/g.283577 Transcript_87589/m.283577 type:complete len:341 (+) Transcript_87589:1-1023(+)